MKGVWLENMTWPEAAHWLERHPVVVVPIGAASKEHGHHLPLCTDYILARTLADGILRQLPVVVAPIVSFAYYPAFRHYPGSQHLAPETFTSLLRDVLCGFIEQGVKNLAVLNTGVSTEPLVNVLLRELYHERRVRAVAAHIRDLGHDADDLFEQKLGGHGDEHETSIMLAAAPDMVRMEKAETDYGHQPSLPHTKFYVPAIFDGQSQSGRDYSATGVRGDPTLASVEKGEATTLAIIEDLCSGLRAIFPKAVDIAP